jgi:hypothetical protein
MGYIYVLHYLNGTPPVQERDVVYGADIKSEREGSRSLLARPINVLLFSIYFA